jgi:lysylphosphatidylglycerol synthetase-like protein (DUF2156 family)
MLEPLTHTSLRSTAALTAYLGAAHTLVLLLLCITLAAVTGEIPFDEPGAWVFMGVLILIFPIPGVALMYFANLIRRASKSAVTISLVVCSLVTLVYALVFLQNLAAIYMFYRLTNGGIAPMGVFVSLVIATSLLAGFIFNIVKLSRSYGVINEIRHGGRRGFAPLMPATAIQAPPPSPPAQWPDITD